MTCVLDRTGKKKITYAKRFYGKKKTANASHRKNGRRKFEKKITDQALPYKLKRWNHNYPRNARLAEQLRNYIPHPPIKKHHNRSRADTPLPLPGAHFTMTSLHVFFLKGNGTHAAMLLDSGQRSMDAWYFMFSICFFSASLSMAARILGSIAQNLWYKTRTHS